jgi:hypothetical protein
MWQSMPLCSGEWIASFLAMTPWVAMTPWGAMTVRSCDDGAQPQ